MALHPNFPASPYAPLLPEHRWFPAAEELRGTAYEKLLPPLVASHQNVVNRELELTSVSHTYAKPGRYTIAVKVIDIFGNDTMTLVPISVG